MNVPCRIAESRAETPLCLMLALGLGAALGSSVAFADAYAKVRDDAALHLQVKVVKVVVPTTTPGDCEIRGEIATIYRDRRRETVLNEPVVFILRCTRGGDPPSKGAWVHTVPALEKAAYIEGYFNRSGKRLVVAAHQAQVVRGPSRTPSFRG